MLKKANLCAGLVPLIIFLENSELQTLTSLFQERDTLVSDLDKDNGPKMRSNRKVNWNQILIVNIDFYYV